jgi:4'-phosphopantetheinyl transferase
MTNPTDKIKINKYLNDDDKRRALGSIILQKDYIHANTQINHKDIVIHYDVHGKPCYNELKYNVSHDNDIVIIVYSDDGDVGVDVMKTRNVIIQNFSSCFTSQEKQSLSGYNFMYFWCAKEALLKAIGVGLRIDLKMVEFDIHTNIIRYANVEHSVVFINIPGYVCAYVTIK